MKNYPLPGPSGSGIDIASLCKPELGFSTLLDLHMRLLAGKVPHYELQWSNLETAQKLSVSLGTVIGWRMGYTLPAPFQLESLVDHLLLSAPARLGATGARSAHPHATPTQAAAMAAALREAYDRDPLPRLSTPLHDPIQVLGRSEFASWLHERGWTMREIGDRIDVSRSRVAQLLQHRQRRLASEAKALAPCMDALVVCSTAPKPPSASVWPFPISIPAGPQAGPGHGAAQRSGETGSPTPGQFG